MSLLTPILMPIKCSLILVRGWLSTGMGVIQSYILVSKLKKTKTNILRCAGYLSSTKPYKARFIANFSSCMTAEVSKLLTPCLTAVKHVIKYCEKVYENSGKNLFPSIKNSGEILDKFKARHFNATILSTYDFFYSVHYFAS